MTTLSEGWQVVISGKDNLLFRPSWEHGDIVCCTCSQENSTLWENVQIEAAKIIRIFRKL